MQTLTINEGIIAIKKLSSKKGFYKLTSGLLLTQLSATLTSMPDQEAEPEVLKEAMRQSSAWLRKVNSRGSFRLPMQKFERVLLREVAKGTGISAEELRDFRSTPLC